MFIPSIGMLSRAWLCLFLLFSMFNTELNGFDLCSSLTQNSTEFNSYTWINQSEKNCGCQNCIRRCCKPGYYRLLGTKYCLKNNTESSLKVPVYSDKTKFVKNVEEITNFIVGPIYCEYFNLNYPLEEFYIQESGTVWVPFFDQFFNNDFYCVDEANGLTPILCIPTEQETVNAYGMYYFRSQYPTICLTSLFK